MDDNTSAEAELQEIDMLGRRAYGLMPSQTRPNHDIRQAYQTFQEAVARGNAWATTWSAQLTQTPALYVSALQIGAWLLWGMGQAASLLGKLDEARAALEQAMPMVFDPADPMKPAIQHALADLAFRQSQFIDARTRYLQAYEGYTKLAQWAQALMVLISSADCAYFLGERNEFMDRLAEAAALADKQQLAGWGRRVRWKLLQFRLESDPTGEILKELENKSALRQELGLGDADLLRLEAQFWSARGNLHTCCTRLTRALGKVAVDDDGARCQILLDIADCEAALHRTAEAIAHAEEALLLAEKEGIVDRIRIALRTLIPLLYARGDAAEEQRAAAELERLRSLGPGQDFVQTLLARAAVFQGRKQFEAALADIDEAERSDPTPDQLRQVWQARIAPLKALGRIDEALHANLHAIELFSEPLAPGAVPSVPAWKALANTVATLHGNAALLLAQAGRVDEAFTCAEKGKAQRLRTELATAGPAESAGTIADVSLAELRVLLAADNAALALFWVANHQTLILVVDPWKDDVQTAVVDIGEVELSQLLPTAEEQTEAAWNDVMLRVLSHQLLPSCLQETARRCGEKQGTLYLVPDSRLYFAPFAALTCDDGMPLLARCPLAYVPSAAVWKWCRGRRQGMAAGEQLVIGAGSEQGISFASQAKEIAALLGADRCLAEPTAEQVLRVLQDSPALGILHIQCHGDVNNNTAGVHSSAQLRFAQESRLTAKDVLNLRGRLQANLVFINACTSGGFHLRSASEVGGFWEAFLAAGATSLIATLIHVHPESAQQVGQDFYRAWQMGKISKAAALRQAQLAVRESTPDPARWATHILVGDHW